jgi:hypothetical protein
VVINAKKLAIDFVSFYFEKYAIIKHEKRRSEDLLAARFKSGG